MAALRIGAGSAWWDQRRSIADSSLAELADLVLTHPTAMDEDDPATSRERLVEAITHALIA